MNNVSGILHKQKLNAMRNNLSPQDRNNVDTSLSVGGALDSLDEQDTARNNKGVDLYNQGKLTTSIASKMDKSDHLNRKAEDFLTSAKYPSRQIFNSIDIHDIKISKQAIKNGAFQKDLSKSINSHLKPKYMNDYAQEAYNDGGDPKNSFNSVDFDGGVMLKMLKNVSAKGFSKNAQQYLNVKAHTPKPMSFSQLSKMPRPKLSHNHSFSARAKSLQSNNRKDVAKRSTHSRNNSRNRKLAMKRNQGMER